MRPIGQSGWNKMSVSITDELDNPDAQIIANLDENTTSGIFVRRFHNCAGYFLKQTDGSSGVVTIKARRTGSGAPFANVAAAPVDLTPASGTFTSLDLEIITGTISGALDVFTELLVATVNP